MQKVFQILVFTMIPLGVINHFVHFGNSLTFLIACLGILGLASYMGRATESLAIISGPRIGGLLNATFGNAVELIIATLAIKAKMYPLVLASITGSVLGNLLLVGGLSFFVGGLKFKRQTINKYDARHNAGLLIFGTAVAFLMPAIFAQTMDESKHVTMSVGISIALIAIYILGLYFKLVSHRGVYDVQTHSEHEHEIPEWSKGKSMTILLLATVGVAFLSEQLVHAIDGVAHSLGWSELFIGVIVVAIVGNAAEHASAIVMAYKNKMDIAVEIAVGSTLQIALFVAPLLVLISLFFGDGMPLLFSVPELIAMFTAVLLGNKVMTDGDVNYFDGAILLGTYFITGFLFYLL